MGEFCLVLMAGVADLYRILSISSPIFYLSDRRVYIPDRRRWRGRRCGGSDPFLNQG